MSDFLHIVCPHYASVNRLQAERMNEQPSCGKCSRAIFTAKPVRFPIDTLTIDKSFVREIPTTRRWKKIARPGFCSSLSTRRRQHIRRA